MENDCPVKTPLTLTRISACEWVDEYGRVLGLYTNNEGKTDLRPVGIAVLEKTGWKVMR